MLSIRQAQFDELARQAQRHAIARIQAILRAELPDEWRRCGSAELPGTPPPEKALSQMVERGLSLGFNGPQQQAGFAALYFVNLRFARAGEEPFMSWTRPLLERQDADADERLALVLQGLAWRGRRSPEAQWAHERLQKVMEAFQ